MMLNLKTHVLLICVVFGYFITVEGIHIVSKDASYPNTRNQKQFRTNRLSDSASDVIEWILRIQSEMESKRQKRLHDNKLWISRILKKGKKNKKGLADRSLRDGSVRNLLQKLQRFIKHNTQNYFSLKRNDCNSGFGNPSKACKNRLFRRHDKKQSRNSRNKYTQHMVVERARSESEETAGSEEEENNEKNSYESDGEVKKPSNKGKRFQIVHKRPAHKQQNAESEESGQPFTSNESDEPADNESIFDNSDAYDSEDGNILSDGSKEGANEDEASNESDNSDDGFMYLQGGRLTKPILRSDKYLSIPAAKNRRGDRLPHFMPKRYKWSEDMWHILDEYWTDGIKAYGRHAKKYWPLVRVGY